MISEAQLLRGKPICINTVGTLVPPTLDKIFSSDKADEDPVEQYLLYLSILQMTLDDFLDKTGLREAFNQIPIEHRQSYGIYNFLILEEHTREILQQSLSFFIAEKVEFNPEVSAFDIAGDCGIIGSINQDNFEQIRTHILRLNCIEYKPPTPLKFADERARLIYEKCKSRGKEFNQAKAKKAKNDIKYSLNNLVRYVATYPMSYNFFNIWDLTIYQFYSEFHSTQLYTQLNAYVHRWSVWGKEKFDFSEYYNNIDILKT